jgi:RimJ/RimL family protein N-acetyltransferase
MTVSSTPPVRVRVQLLQLPAGVIDALAQGDQSSAQSRLLSTGVPAVWPLESSAGHDPPAPVLTPYLVSAESRRTWVVRSAQLAADPASADWITRVVYDPDRQLVVGKAGFHGPPDASGMVEIGYAIDPLRRRRGYARAAVEVMLQHARSRPEVRTVRASISPDNHPSLNLVAQYGFVAVGEQIDEEDGLEVIYEVAM